MEVMYARACVCVRERESQVSWAAWPEWLSVAENRRQETRETVAGMKRREKNEHEEEEEEEEEEGRAHGSWADVNLKKLGERRGWSCDLLNH